MKEKHITVHIIGGLGNQLFQIATAIAYGQKNDSRLLIDNYSYETYKLHDYLLTCFSIEADEIRYNLKKKLMFIFAKLLNKLKIHCCFFGIYSEKDMLYDNSLMDKKRCKYLTGYFQSYKYFNFAKNTLRSNFEIKSEYKSKNIALLEKIKNSNSVMVHVRRGDYATNKVTKEKHGLCSVSYYKTAIGYISTIVEKPVFFIFTNDMEWCKNNFELEDVQYIAGSRETTIEDFDLMRECKYHIIANSTFSWWAAYLSYEESKKVVYPSPWFNILEFNENDLIPAEWYAIPKNKAY